MIKIFINKKSITMALLFLLALCGTIFAISKLITKRSPSSIVVVKDEEKEFKFIYKFQNKILELAEKSTSKENAFRQASKKCFQYYTQGKYPGEEKGLDIIDSCSNPKSGL